MPTDKREFETFRTFVVSGAATEGHVMTGTNNLNKFVLEAGPDDCIVKCRITRNCKGLDKGRSWTVLVS